MRTDHYFDSHGAGRIHFCRWTPQGKPRAVLQIVHGIAERVERYDHFAEFLNSLGYLVVAEDHMGHGKSLAEDGIRGYFHGGWFAAIEDTCQLMQDTMAEFPTLPYVLFGHSMGSFMARTVLAKYPECGIDAAIICGTGWMPTAALPVMVKMMEGICKVKGERNPVQSLHDMVFGGYNKQIPDARTEKDWLTRNEEVVDAYIADPLCGFVSSCGLMRDMVKGIHYNQQPKNLKNMKKYLPVFFIAGGEDPVGPYGKGVEQAAEAFRKAGMVNVSCKIYPDCRHEILNELNQAEVYQDIADWLSANLVK